MALAGAIAAAQALQAVGCPRDRASIMVATAERESSYNPLEHSYGRGCGPGMCGRPNGAGTVCEDSYGLWQINRCAHPQFSPIVLLTSLGNAAAARDISGRFSNLSPWRGGASPTSDSDRAVALVYSGRTRLPGQSCVEQVITFLANYTTAHNLTPISDPQNQAKLRAAALAKFPGKTGCVDQAIAQSVAGDKGQVLPETVPGLVGSAPGDILSELASGALDAGKALAFLVGWLISPDNWKRLGMAVAGGILVIAGLWFASKDWQRSGREA